MIGKIRESSSGLSIFDLFDEVVEDNIGHMMIAEGQTKVDMQQQECYITTKTHGLLRCINVYLRNMSVLVCDRRRYTQLHMKLWHNIL